MNLMARHTNHPESISAPVLSRIAALLLTFLALIVLCSCKTQRNNEPGSYSALTGSTLHPGDTFTFGSYEQDNDLNNGAEPIEWQVLTVENGRALVISRYALDAVPYNKASIFVTWHNSSLRKWLNGEFLTNAFDPSERNSIVQTTLENHANPSSGTRGGSPTKDRIFLLSIDEAGQYFADDDARQCEATSFAKANGAYVGDNGKSWWWLRSPGCRGQSAAIVLYVGYITHLGYEVSDPSNVVRPAFWLTL